MKKEESIIVGWYDQMRKDKPELKKEFISEGSLLYWLAEKQIINFSHSSLPLKEKETLSFDKWITLERTRVEFYEGFLNGDKNCRLGTLYRKYKNEVLNL